MTSSRHDDQFNDFLDQLEEHAARDELPAGELRSEMTAAIDIRTLAARTTTSDRMETAMQRTWENLTMQPASTTNQTASPLNPISAPAPFGKRQSPRQIAVKSVLNSLLAAVIVIGLVIGYRGLNNGGNSGNDGGNLAMLTASGTPDATATLPPTIETNPVLNRATLEAQGILEPEATPPPLPHIPCTTPAITRESAIQRLNFAGPAVPNLDMSKVESVDAETVKAVEEVGEQFFSCLAEGKTMSAINLMSSDYLQQWLFIQVMALPGGPSDSSINTLFDQFEQEQAAAEASGEFAYPANAISYFFGGGFSKREPNGPVQTADGRIHVGFTFSTVYSPGAVPDSPSHTQPRDIVFVQEGNSWRIDSLEHGNDAYFEDPF